MIRTEWIIDLRTIVAQRLEPGHTDPALALRVYRQAMRRDDGEKGRLKALVEGDEMPTAAPVSEIAV